MTDTREDREAFLAQAVSEWERLNDLVESPISAGIDPEPDLQREWDDAAHEVAERAQAFLAWPAKAEGKASARQAQTDLREFREAEGREVLEIPDAV
jgi:hypothetical protein